MNKNTLLLHMENPFQIIIQRLEGIEYLLHEVQKTTGQTSTDARSKILTLSEFCAHTGVSKQTAYKLTSTQSVPHSKRGKRLYFDREQVDTWLLENRVKTNKQIQEQAKTYFQTSTRRRG